MAVVVRFPVLTRVIPLVLILSAIPRNLRELMLHQKEILTQRGHFSRYGTDCPNNRLSCLCEFVEGYYSQD